MGRGSALAGGAMGVSGTPRAVWQAVALLCGSLSLSLSPAAGLGPVTARPSARAVDGVTAATAAPAEPPRLLLVALDGVPYTAVRDFLAEARADGRQRFAGFAGPVPLISSFPSTTHPAMAGLFEPFGAQPSPGYEARFFDRGQNRIRGCGPISYHRVDVPWQRLVDRRNRSLAVGMVRKLRPVKSSVAEVERALAAFARSAEPVYVFYLATTDGLGHLRSPRALGPVLEALDRELVRLRTDPAVSPFHTVVFSDHGMAGGEPLADVRDAVRRRLVAAGFRLGGRLGGPAAAVVAENGMISSFEVHTAPGREAAAARAVVAVPGVDLCVVPEAGGWVIESARGRARFARRERQGQVEWSYRPETGDPLLYAPLAARLGEGDPWFADEAWFAASWDAHYPDALHRLARAFDLVASPASAACSLEPGWMFAARRTKAAARLSIGRLRWTHGALEREPSWGVLLTDFPGWEPPAAVRFDEALKPFASAVGDHEPAGEEVPFSRPPAAAR